MAGRQVLSAAVRGGVRKQTTAANTATTFSSSLEPSVFDEFTTSVRISETEKSVRSRTAKTVKLNWEGVKLFHPLPEGTSKSKWKFPHGNLSQLSFQAALKIWPPSSSPTPSSSSSSSTPISRKKKKEAISSTTTSPILTPSENRARLLSMSLEEVEKSLVTLCSEMTTEFVTQSKKSKTTTVSSSSSSSSTTKEEVLAGAEWVARNLSACTSFPWEDIVASPFSLRLQALAVESGLYAVNHEFRGYPAEKSLAEQGSKSNRGQLSGAAPSLVTTSTDFSKPKWKRGQLIVPSFETHRRGRERPLMVLHPQLMAKQSSLEAAAAISGPFWHKNVTNWELYMATRAAKTLEASTFYFIDDVLRTRDPNLLPWFRGTPLGGIYAEEGKRIAQEKVGTRYPSRDFLLEGQVTTKDAGEGGGVVKERISFKQPSGLFPRWVDVESLKQKDYSDWLRQQAKLLQDGVRVFDREIKALREQISLQEPFPSLYHPECPNLAVSEEAFDFLLHHANRFVGNPLYSLAINHVIPRPPLPASSSALTSPSSYIPCSTLNEYLDHLENFVDRLLFQPIQVRSDQFFARAKARTLADYLAQVSLVPLPGENLTGGSASAREQE